MYKSEELQKERERKLKEQERSDREQWEIDVEKIRQNRVRKLRETFPEVNIDLEKVPEGTDIYTKAKRDIFYFYEARLRDMGRDIKDYGQEFDRNKVNEGMLKKLKELVLHLERRQVERIKR